VVVDAEGHLFAGHAQAGEGQAELLGPGEVRTTGTTDRDVGNQWARDWPAAGSTGKAGTRPGAALTRAVPVQRRRPVR
jgi:hypothetical protein